jgi:predicted nucleotidyltransferase
MDKFIYYILPYNIMKQEKQQLHYPRLDTILMVEKTLGKKGEYRSKRSLWISLPKKMMYQTFSLILEYLEESGKIAIKEGRVIWILNPELASRYRKPKPKAKEVASESILKLIEENKAALGVYHVKDIGLFGSYARGEEREDSDIDVLVEFQAGQKTFDNYMNLKFFLEKLFNHKVDLVIKEAVKPELRERIFKSVVYAA